MPFSMFKKTPSTQTLKKIKKTEADESEEARKTALHEIDTLRTKITEKEKNISLMRAELAKNERIINKAQMDNKSLTQALNKSKHEVSKLKSTSQINSQSKEEIIRARQANENYQKLHSDLEVITDKCRELEMELDEERARSSIKTQELNEEVNDLTKRLIDTQTTSLENEKAVSELRLERNQREAKISSLEKSLIKSDTRRKELEVDINRIRQQLTDARQTNLQLSKEVNKTLKIISSKGVPMIGAK